MRENQALRDSVSVTFSSVRAAGSEWELLTEDKKIFQVIKHGIEIPLVQLPQPLDLLPRGKLGPLIFIIDESICTGAVRPLAKSKARSMKHWIPMSVVKKRDSGKSRLIYQIEQAKHIIKPDSWKTVQELLQDPSICWDATVDMANWFHHLALSNKARRWARLEVQGRAYKTAALPFGMASSPFWAHGLSKPILEWAIAQKLTPGLYVNNVLILGKSAQEVE